ncbi:hypothetical protein CDD82_4587 [Ophiocordyceps australis]|uniref:MARVEL domain-containing protein n=1 Tax=Ophiocordyceps australis TaxID=1399860 RepID=A0A2C5ZTU5_9HYPO|nr:hypothetical protein CDD82_4587 [Ophiocordyceps australis]
MEQPPSARQDASHVLATPGWFFGLRIAQMLLCFIILALSGAVVGNVYLDELGLTLAVSLLSMIALGYMIVSERVAACRAGYNVYAVLALEGLFVILWLAAFAAAAGRRSRFSYTVVTSDANLYDSLAGMTSAVAGLGAFVWFTFIATFTWTLLSFLSGRKQGRFNFNLDAVAATSSASYPMDQKMNQQPPPTMAVPEQSQTPYQQQAPYMPPTAQSPPPQQMVHDFPLHQAAQYPAQAQSPSQHPGQQPSPYPLSTQHSSTLHLAQQHAPSAQQHAPSAQQHASSAQQHASSAHHQTSLYSPHGTPSPTHYPPQQYASQVHPQQYQMPLETRGSELSAQ